VHLEGAELLADLSLCTALAAPARGNKNPDRRHALANVAGAAAEVRSNYQLCYDMSRLPRMGSPWPPVALAGPVALGCVV